MIKILISLLISINLFANDIKSELEMVFFKAGLDAMVNEFETEKNTTRQQQKSIEFLVQKVYQHEKILKNISQEKEENTLEIKVDETAFENIQKDKQLLIELQNQIQLLRKEVESYKEIVENIQQKTINQSNIKTIDPIEEQATINSTFNKARVGTKELYVRKKANNSSEKIATLPYNTMIELEFCDPYGWCKLKNPDGYVAKFLLKFDR